MKNLLKASLGVLLITSGLVSPVIAGSFPFGSNVTQVTVYPRGAQVTRVALGKIDAGEHVILVNDLPGTVQASSIQVEGVASESLEIRSVDIRREVVTTKDNSSERSQLEKQIEVKNDEIASLKEDITNAFAQRSLLQSLAGQAILPNQDKDGGVRISVEELDALMNMTGARFGAISVKTEQARIGIRKLREEIELLQRQVTELAPHKETRTIVAINVALEKAGEAEFFIRYGVESAKWEPVYDARLSLGEKGDDAKLTLVRRASVFQATAEKWDGVSLTLSTARPSGRTQAPNLSPFIIRENKPRPAAQARTRIFKKPAFMANEAPQELESRVASADRSVKLKKAIFKDAVVELGGFLAEFKIGGKVSVDNTGLSKNVSIGSSEVSADIYVRSVPKIDAGAYLTANFKIEGNAPWLPGKVMLSRDGVFLGKTKMPLLNPDTEHSLGFGLDDFIKVERVQITDKKGETGFISTSNVDERKFVTTVKNQHDFPMRVIIEDQIPYATHEDIKVEISGKSKPTETNIGKKRGLLAWENTVGAGKEYVINFGYKVSWPKEMDITPFR